MASNTIDFHTKLLTDEEEAPAPTQTVEDDNADPQDADPHPPPHPPNVGPAPPEVSLAGIRKTYHPNASTGIPGGNNLLQQMATGMDADNIYHPFWSEEDWEMGKWLTDSGLPQLTIDKFLKLKRVSIMIIFTILYIDNSYR